MLTLISLSGLLSQQTPLAQHACVLILFGLFLHLHIHLHLLATSPPPPCQKVTRPLGTFFFVVVVVVVVVGEKDTLRAL